jgi:hypothetical protein
MSIRTTVDIPETLHDRLRERSERSGASIRSLVIHALEQLYTDPQKGEYVTGPQVRGAGKLGPEFPVTENPHDHVFS